MTRDGDWSRGAPQAGTAHAGYHPHADYAGATEASRIESLLHSVIDRLEENESRYNSALNALEKRLNELSARATGSAGPQSSADRTDAFARLGNQAAELAQQVRSASQSQRPQSNDDRFKAVQDRISEFAARMQQRAAPPPGQGTHRQHQSWPSREQPTASMHGGYAYSPPPPGFSQQFANAAAGFEQSLAAGHATAELEAINARIDDLVQRFDVMASSRHGDSSTLDTVEIQLNNLAAQFDQAREHYARVDAIEANLVHLMEMTRQSESRIEAAAVRAAQEAARSAGGGLNQELADRLDAVQRELQALSSLTGPGGAPAPARPPETSSSPYSAATAPRPEPAQAPQHLSSKPATAADPLRDDLERSRVGASIPDFEPAPRFTGLPGGQDRTGVHHFDDDADFLASARRAAAAAAANAEPKPKGKSLLSVLHRRGRPRPRTVGEPTKPRSLFVAATVFLMIASAALIYGRLNENVGGATVDAPGKGRPAQEQAPPKHDSSSMLSGTPHLAERKDEGRLPAVPAPAERLAQTRAPLASDAAPSEPASGATKQSADTGATPDLAAFPSHVHIDPDIPGIAVRIVDDNAAPAAGEPPVQQAAIQRQVPAPQRPSPSPAPEAGTPTAPIPPAAIGPQSLRVAASRGDAAAQYEIAARYAKGSGIKQDYKLAAEWFARAAAQSFAPAQYRLAGLYERGRGVGKDPAMAKLWYERAAKAGNIRAMHNLAVILSGGGNHRPDHAAAAKWFTEAARHGLRDSQFNLGILHEAGLGVKQDLLEAYQWFALAAIQGDAEAKKRKQAVARKLRPDQVHIADRAVKLWQSKSVDKAANEVRPPEGGWRAASVGNGASGGEKELVLRAQSLLNELGYDAGVPDGLSGPQTAAAIRRFQQRNGLAQDGEVTADLVARLEARAS